MFFIVTKTITCLITLTRTIPDCDMCCLITCFLTVTRIIQNVWMLRVDTRIFAMPRVGTNGWIRCVFARTLSMSRVRSNVHVFCFHIFSISPAWFASTVRKTFTITARVYLHTGTIEPITTTLFTTACITTFRELCPTIQSTTIFTQSSCLSFSDQKMIVIVIIILQCNRIW